MTPHDERRLLDTPFASRAQAACELRQWALWKGYASAIAYEDMELEYFAVRNATGVFDLTPMTKCRIGGPDAAAFLNRLMTRDVGKIRPGRVGYALWCTHAGMVLDDGPPFHLSLGDCRLCAQERCLDWLLTSALGLDFTVVDEAAEVAALAVQGPTSCAALRGMGLDGLEALRPFGLRHYPFDGGELMVSRTGFTGDLGYEVWIAPAHAEALWDALFAAGRNHHIRPMVELARIEAGFIQAGVDFVPAEQVVRHGQVRSPFELGLAGWWTSTRGTSPDAAPCCGSGRRARSSASRAWTWQATSRHRIPSSSTSAARRSATPPPPPGAPPPSATWRSPRWKCLGAALRMSCTPKSTTAGNCAGPALERTQ